MEVNCNIGTLVSNILASMHKFKSNHKKSFNLNNIDYLVSKEACAALTPETRLNWNKIAKDMKTKTLKDKHETSKTSTCPNKPPHTQNNIAKARMKDVVTSMLSDASVKDSTITTESNLKTSSDDSMMLVNSTAAKYAKPISTFKLL